MILVNELGIDLYKKHIYQISTKFNKKLQSLEALLNHK